jgi:tetratricopeptide (TPR) repeat protein
MAKRLYVIVQKNFDIEENPYAVDVILISLAKLRQIKKIEKLVNDKTVVKIVPKARLASFKIYSLLVTGKIEKAVRYYKEIVPSLPSAQTASILFNMAEAYFRLADYKRAIKLFDKFATYYSGNEKASAARLRIALSYDLLDRDPKIVSELYKNAIDRSARDKISLEAKMRYVAYRKIRKKHLTEADKRVSLLLNFKEGESLFDNHLKKMLWSVRLRSYIVDKEFFKGLSYLNAIPVSSLKPSERRMFNGDGAEIVLGIIQKSYEDGNFSKIIRLWEVYQSKYINKVALDPYINYIVGNSYIKLGLYDSFDTFYNGFKTKKSSPKRQFPIWIKRQSHANAESLIEELLVIKNIKLKNWNVANKSVVKMSNNRRKFYYLGIINYGQKKYKQAVKYFENYFASNSDDKIHNSDDLGNMLDAYMKSIYQSGDMTKYERVGSAIVNDLAKSKKLTPYLLSVKEEISYMIIENIYSNKKFAKLLESVKKFQTDYKNSIYKDRIKYLQAVALVRTQRETEGQKILQTIINDKNVPSYLKELSKTELSLLKIKNKLI